MKELFHTTHYLFNLFDVIKEFNFYQNLETS